MLSNDTYLVVVLISN